MPLDDDLTETPKCLLCDQRREGRRYRLWAATHVSTRVGWSFLSDGATVTKKYRDVKRVSFYSCQPCAKWAIRCGAAQYVAIVVFFAVLCFITTFVIPDKDRDVRFGMGVIAGVLGLLAVAWAIRSLVPNTESNRYDEDLRDVATTRLKAKGKGDTHFTQAEYDTGFLKNLGDDQGPARPKTAAELLQGEDDDDRPRRRRKRPE